MQKLVKEYLDELSRRQKKERKIAVAVMLLVVIVVGTVAGILTQYGVAMTGKPRCGLEEHTHGEDCYTKKLICNLEEGEGHTHTEACKGTPELTCGQEESEGHTHTEACKGMPELTCGQEEGEDHTHTEACYTVPEEFICGLEESEGHTHTDSCYTLSEEYICGRKEQQSHAHGEDCYTEELTCGKKEHRHTDACYIDAGADTEDSAVWDAQYAGVQWTENWGEDLVTAARMQIGYEESRNNYKIAEDGSHKGYTRYGQFAGDPYADWSAAFVNFCIYYAGSVESGLFPKTADSGKWQEEFNQIDEKNHTYLADAAGYIPVPGDIVFLNQENEPSVRMGIVSGYEQTSGEAAVIEGDSGDSVKENRYNVKAAEIVSYVKISEMEAAYKDGGKTEEEPAPEAPAVTDQRPDGEGTNESGSVIRRAPRYDKNNIAYVTDFTVKGITDGSAPWDETDGPGNDRNSSNGIVRTFDTVQYKFSVTMATRDEHTMLKEACIELRFELPASKKQAEFDLAAMAWLDEKNVEEKTDEDGRTYQVLTGKKLLRSEENYVVPGTYQSHVVIKIKDMKNGDVLNPVFSAAMENNAQNEWKEIEAGEVLISAAPKYNIYVKGEYSYRGTFDFNTGTQNAANKGEGPFIGRAVKVGIALQLYNDNESKGLKGIAFPDSDEGITFDLELGTGFSVGEPAPGTGWERDKLYEVTDKGYMPLLWSYDGSQDFGYGGADQNGRTLDDYDWSRTMVPDNELKNPENPDPKDQERSCYNGGNWEAVQTGSNVAVRVKGWEIVPEQMPKKNGVGTDNMYGTNVGCFSAGEFVFVQPFNKKGSTSQEPNYDILNEYGTGTFHTSIEAKNLRVGNKETESQDNKNKNVMQVFEVTTPGFMSNNVGYLKCGEDGRWASPGWTDGHFGLGDSYTLAGEDLNLAGGFSYQAGDDYGRLCWGSSFMRFEGEKLDLIEGGITSCFANGATLDGNGMQLEGPGQNTYVFYATKKDGSKWSGLAEMQDALEENMIFYKSLNDIPTGHVCVGILICFKGNGTSATNGTAAPIYEIAHRAKAKKEYIGQTCALLSTSRVWPEQVFKEDNIDPKQIQFVYQKDERGKDTLKELYKYRPKDLGWGWLNGIVDGTWGHLGYETHFERLPLSVSLPGEHYRSGNTAGIAWNKELSKDSTKGSLEEWVGSFYQPTEYRAEGGIKQTHNSDNMHWGDTLLICGYEAKITKSLMQTETVTKEDGTTAAETKKAFSLNEEQRVADYKLNPATVLEGSDTVEQTTDIKIVDTLPKHMRYIPGSAYFGGKYEQTSPSGGTQGAITDGTPKEPVLGIDGDKQTLTWTIPNVTVGKEIDPIYYSAEIGDKESPENDIKDTIGLSNEVYIAAEGDKRTPTLENGKKAEVAITVQRDEETSFGKTVSQKITEEDGTIDYTIYFNNFTKLSVDALVVDTMPAKSAANPSKFDGTYELLSCKLDDKNNTDNIEVYYTMDHSYTSESVVTSEFIKQNGSGWEKATITDKEIDVKQMSEPPAAWAVLGMVEGGHSIRVDLEIKLIPDASDRVDDATNYFVNTVSDGNPANGIIAASTQTVRRVLEGLAWIDDNRNGQRDDGEELLSGIKVELLKLKDGGDKENEDSYENVCYPGTNTHVAIQTGQQVSVRKEPTPEKMEAGSKALSEEELKAAYRFMDLPPGTYAVRFSDGENSISGFKPSKTDVGNNEETDSDGQPFYSSDGSLQKTVIFGIEMPDADEIGESNSLIYNSRHNDSGFYPGVELLIVKNGKGAGEPIVLPNAEFTLLEYGPDENGAWKEGSEQYHGCSMKDGSVQWIKTGEQEPSDISPGTYLMKEVKAPGHYMLSTEEWKIIVEEDEIPIVTTKDGDPVEFKKSEGKDGKAVYTYTFYDTLQYELPSAGGSGIYWYMFCGVLLMSAAVLITYKNKCKEVLGVKK